MSLTKTYPQRHVAAMAFPFGCHAQPLLNLVIKLATELPDTQFSFFNTGQSNNFLSIRSNINLPPNIKAYDVDDGVPINHVLSKNPVEKLDFFIKVTPDNFKTGLEIAVSETNKNICCLITDGFLTFAEKMAEEMEVPWVPLWVPAPQSLSVHVYTDMIRKVYGRRDINKTLDRIPGLSQIHVADLPEEILSSGSQYDDDVLFTCMLSKIENVLKQSTIVVVNFCQELYPSALLIDLKSKFSKLLNVGFLTLAVQPSTQLLGEEDSTGCLSWLDEHKPLSVAYISFGTVATLPPSEIVELAEALEITGVPFIWSLKEYMKPYLPNEFLSNTSKQGIVVPWAPQARILAHNSTGVFVTHFGANSVNESIANGVPMIGRPFFGDHKLNGRIVEEINGIGVRVEDDLITKKNLVKSLELVLGDEQGREMRRKIGSLREVALQAYEPNGSATNDFKSLVQEIFTL
ncbi:hypothetical protein ACFE04_029918 [Oxalis oulophora]